MDGLLDFSRVGRLGITPVELDMEELAGSVLAEMLVGRRPEPVVTLEAMPKVRADAAMLRIVWSNLLSNALKFSRDRDPARIEIGGRPMRGHSVFYVRDNGVGFDEDAAGRLFGVFERLHSKKDFEGSGVGLAIVRRIVRRHGGRTWARAVPGRGALFLFSLPDVGSDDAPDR
jgi:signal transduction histidine kinase